MKVWKLTMPRSSGVNNTFRQCLSLPSFSWDNLRENKPCDSYPEIANTGAPQATSKSSTLVSDSLLAYSSFCNIFQQAVPELRPDSLRPSSTTSFYSRAYGGWWKWQNGFRQNLHLTQYLLEIKWSSHARSHSSQTFHGKTRLDYQLVDLHVLFFNALLILISLNLSASNDVRMIYQGYVEEWN